MVMHISDVDPLYTLICDLGLGEQIVPCGSKQGRQMAGFCQALLAQLPQPAAHTTLVHDSLKEAGAAFASSHELFLGHWQSSERSFEEWFALAAAPLVAQTGCVPVLITGLAATDPLAKTVFNAAHQLGEPVLVRMLLGDVDASSGLFRSLVAAVGERKRLPLWWPLIQASANTSLSEWQALATSLGDYWRYVCVAVDPFASSEVREFLRWQTVVVQIPVGGLEDIKDVMQIPNGMLSAFPDGVRYSLPEYLASLPGDKKDIVIILGPSRPEWSCDYNIKRIVAIKELLSGYGVVI